MLLIKAVLCSLSLLLASDILAQAEAPEEIIVIGKQPGPPLWKVSNGENVLWIFGAVSPVQEDMTWESQKVGTVISQSQEYIAPPDTDVSLSKLVVLNPINIVRGLRLAKRLSRNPEKSTLEDVLPTDLYQRFALLKSRYFPDNDDIELSRPIVAGSSMISIVQEQEGLQPNADVLKEIRRLVRRNRDMKKTEIEIKQKIDGNYRALANRAENFMNNLSPELEQACFATRLERLEQDIDGMKRRANAWAEGYVDELREIQVPDEERPCENMLRSSTEYAFVEELRGQADAMWLDAAEQALNTNKSTFAVLRMNDLLSEDGLFAKLKARGYQAVEP